MRERERKSRMLGRMMAGGREKCLKREKKI
jgi:hypothetical protein